MQPHTTGRPWPLLLLVGTCGIALGALVTVLVGPQAPMGVSTYELENEPLYWVAPMDPNYRRDGPGKSPMGMDLVPVYASEEPEGDDTSIVRIRPEVENNLGVRTTTVEQRVLSPSITSTGIVQYDEDQLRHIHPRVSGWIHTLNITASGDPVTQGEPLYTLYSPELVNAEEDLLQALNQNNPRLIAAAEERMRALMIPEAAIDQIKRTRKVAQTITFYAPKTGVVDNLNVRQGFFVEPGVNLMTIAALDSVWVEAQVFASQASFIKPGLPAVVTLDYQPGLTLTGHVDYIYPELDPITRALRLRLKFANPNQLLQPGMFVNAAITAQTQAVVTVDSQAVIRTGQQNRVVLALGDGRFQSVPVTLGQSDGRWQEIIDGVNPGDRVVLSAQFLLDSESSKGAEFRRMQTPTEDIQRASVQGTINSIDTDTRVINVSREAIEKWNRAPATLDFLAAPSVSLRDLQKSKRIQFEFEIRAGEFVITQATPLTGEGRP